MFPAPTTNAICTPRPETSCTCVAIRSSRSGSVPYSSGPIRASPERFRRTRLNVASAISRKPKAAGGAGPAAGALLLAHHEPRKTGDPHVLAGLGGELRAERFDRLALVAVGAHVLLVEQRDLPLPLRELPVDDSRHHVIRLALPLRLRLEHPAL